MWLHFGVEAMLNGVLFCLGRIRTDLVEMAVDVEFTGEAFLRTKICGMGLM